MTFEIETSGPMLAIELFGRPKSLEVGSRLVVPGQATIELQGLREQRDADLHTVVTLGVTFASGVAVNLFSSWLYDKLKSRARRLRIDRVEIQVEAAEIKRVLLERIEGQE